MCVCIWGGIREVGLGSLPFKKRAALGPGGSSLMESQDATICSTGLGELYPRIVPRHSLLSPTSWALGQVREGQIQLWPCCGGHARESRGRGELRADSASWPSPSFAQIRVRVLSSSCNCFCLILLRVLHRHIYLLSDDAL